MSGDRLQDLLNIILFADEITTETDNAHIEIVEAFDNINERTCKKCEYYSYESGRQPDGIGWESSECEFYGNDFSPSMIQNDGCNKFKKKRKTL